MKHKQPVIILLLSLALIISGLGFKATPSETIKKGGLFMNLGSPIALDGSNIVQLDKDNPGLVPIVHNNRTLVPLRSISEHFGAAVDYDEKTKTAKIQTSKNAAEFTVKRNYYLLNEKKIYMDTETIVVGNRVFVPLRTICENVLGLSIDYRDRVIYIDGSAPLTDEMVVKVKSRIGMYIKVTDLSVLKEHARRSITPTFDMNGISVDKSNQEAETSTEDSSSGGSADKGDSNSFSTTNIQTEGVDEGDIIKTDGKYIYAMTEGSIKIIKAEKGSMTEISSFNMKENSHPQEIYIDENRIIIVGSRQDGGYHIMDDALPYKSSMILPYPGFSFAFVQILDTSDIYHPEEVKYFEIEGNIAASRKYNGHVYLLTNYSKWHYNGDDPRPLMERDGRLSPMPIEDIMIMPLRPVTQLLTLSAIDVLDPDNDVKNNTVAGSGFVSYMSNKAFYVAMNENSYGEEQSISIARFSLDGRKIGYAGSVSVSGGINDQFSFDEYQGFLRIATTVDWPKTYNNLYVLDENMDVCGSITGFAKGERIYSARFMGDRGYVVTFRQVDPLFVFDLSDPYNPEITGELKVPGFSTYLHPVSKDIILGVGQDVYDVYRKDSAGNDTVISQQVGGIKISLFDVSDMGKPREIDNMVLGDYGYTELLYNHKAAMFKTDEGILGFCGDISGIKGKDHIFKGAFLISYDGNELTEIGRLAYKKPFDKDVWYEDMFYGERLIYIGDIIYYLQDGLIRSYNLNDLHQLDSLNLTKV